MLDYVKSKYKHYTNDPSCVYKMCDDMWIVIMRKLSNTITNETRENVEDMMCAKFRANMLEVLEIVNIHTGTTVGSIRHKFITHRGESVYVLYEIPQIVKSDSFDNNLN